jgi:hypothetical protein
MNLLFATSAVAALIALAMPPVLSMIGWLSQDATPLPAPRRRPH